MTTGRPPSDASGQRWQGAPSPRARAVEVSFWLWIVYLTLDVAVVFGVGLGALIEATLFINAIMLIVAVLMRLGHNRARIVLAVFGGLRLLFGLFVLTASADPIRAFLFLLVAAAVTTMFLPAANAWFVSRQRES